ncbi:hypothetical protein TGAMA5MH_00876 [Trichoderma gamsii]|uniref:Short-chain dehydrogenase n=1 Tax=Trichoderma gamsii TaxID=398673 RepID=A0A2K0TQM1_9HYPO|nr:hypothetical protein TGAMA5MH_00876 [Trichoderma gamsii]
MTTLWDPLREMPKLQGKIAVVTGGSGIGLEIVGFLARKGAKVYCTTRSENKAKRARDVLRAKYPEIDQEKIKWVLLDLSDLRSITDAADELKSNETKLDILSILQGATPLILQYAPNTIDSLVNNAAAATMSHSLVAGRWEWHMAVNFIGPFLFVNRVLPLLKNATNDSNSNPDVRIVTLSSIAHANMLPHNFEFHFDSPSCLANPVVSYPWQWRYIGRFIFGFDMIRYAASKAAVVMFAKGLQSRLDAGGLPILSLSVHPGEVATEGVMAINNVFIKAIARLTFLTSQQGAATPLFAATASKIKQNQNIYGGKFLTPYGKIQAPHPVVEDAQQLQGLWEHTTKEVNEQLMALGIPPLDRW